MTPLPVNTILRGDAGEVLSELPPEIAQTCVTSPPYFNLRDYGAKGQLGREKTPAEYVHRLKMIFREVWRVLRHDATLWLVMGDSYSNGGGFGDNASGFRPGRAHQQKNLHRGVPRGLKSKDLMGIPWRIAFALQEDGWYLRDDIIWHKPNPMPDPVTDRPTRAHEYVFLFSKKEKYFYDHLAIAEPVVYGDHPRNGKPGPPVQAPGQAVQSGITRRRRSGNKQRLLGPGRARPGNHLEASVSWEDKSGVKNCRDVWAIPSEPFPEAHFAVFPKELARRCVRAGSGPGDIVLDPFMGAGTTAVVALQEGRKYLGVELSPKYIRIAQGRIQRVLGGAQRRP